MAKEAKKDTDTRSAKDTAEAIQIATNLLEAGKSYTVTPKGDGWKFTLNPGRKVETWAMSSRDLAHPKDCNSNDQLIAEIGIGVVVLRNGIATDRHTDGTPGVSDPDVAKASNAKVLVHVHSGGDQLTSKWRQVLVSDKGGFVSFADEAPRVQIKGR